MTEPQSIEEANAALNQKPEPQSIEEANAALGIKPEELGIRGTLKVMKEAEYGRELSTWDTIKSYIPFLDKYEAAKENEAWDALISLNEGKYDNYLQAVGLARKANIPEDEMRKIREASVVGVPNAFGIYPDADLKQASKMFKEWAGRQLANRIKVQEEATRKLSENKTGFVEDASIGLVGAIPQVAALANKYTSLATLPLDVYNRASVLRRGHWTVDENGNPQRALLIDENGKPKLRSDGEPMLSQGDDDATAVLKATGGALLERAVWMAMGLKRTLTVGGKVLDKIPGAREVAAKGIGKSSEAFQKAISKMAATEGGRTALKTFEVVGKINDKLHFGSLPDMIYKSRLTELTDNVIGLNRMAGEQESIGQWLENFVSIEGNAELLTNIIGIHLLTAGYGAVKAKSYERAFRHLDANGRPGGREEFVAEYIGKEQASKLSNTDLDNIYRLVTSPDLTKEKVEDFIGKLNRDQAEAQKKIDAGESIASVIEGIKERSRAGAEGIKTAAERIKETLENKAKLTPAMEDALDTKIGEYTKDLGTAAESVSKMVKDDILANTKDNAVYEQPDMLDELVAMSMRKFNSEGRRMRIHDVRGEKNTGEQLKTINQLGITSWEQAEAEGLVTKDKYGRYGGGARRALNIALHGTEKLQQAVRDGKVGGELAEDLMTAAQCELGARPAEEQAALVDGILERANGDEALARRMLEKLEADTEARQYDKLDERLDRIAAEAKVDAIKERNGTNDETARGAAVEPVETEDGQIKTVGEVVDADTSTMKKFDEFQRKLVEQTHANGGITVSEFQDAINAVPKEIRQEMDKDPALMELLKKRNELYRQMEKNGGHTDENKVDFERSQKAVVDAINAFVQKRLAERIDAALNTNPKLGKVLKGVTDVQFAKLPSKLKEIGVPDGDIYTHAFIVRKLAKEHNLTSTQIADIPNAISEPVAVFRDNAGKGFVILTDRLVADNDGRQAPLMIYLKPDGKGNYLASAYSRTERGENQYVNLVNSGAVLFVDKGKVAALPLRGEVKSSLETFSDGNLSANNIANYESNVNTEPKPTTALGGAEQADRLAGTKLTVFNGTTMGCETFPEAKVNVSADGVTVRGLTADTMAKPENVADVAAFMTHLMRISKRNGIRIEFEDADAAKIAQALVTEISQQGAAKTMAKLETRGKLFGLLFKTTLGNGVTYDEASFRDALKNTNNGRQFVGNHGDVYGFVDADGILHFNPATFNMDTPIHEYGHLALEATKKINNTLWKKGNELIKGTQYFKDVVEESKNSESPYFKFDEELICDEALARLIGDRGAKLVESRGLDAQLKAWLKEVWKAFKGALGIADLTDEQIERMTVGDFADAINAELLKGGEFGTKKKVPPEKRSIRRFDDDPNSGSNGMLRWKNDRGRIFEIPVDMERTQPGGKVVFATDDANITDWIQNTLNGYELRLSKSGKLYVKGRDGLPDELAEIFGRYPTIGQNDGIYDQIEADLGRRIGDTPDQLVAALREDRANYDAWTQGRDAEAEHLAMEEARANAEAASRWENSGMSVMDYIRSRVEEGDPEFDLDWETAREMEHDRAAGKFQVSRQENNAWTKTIDEFTAGHLAARTDVQVLPRVPVVISRVLKDVFGVEPAGKDIIISSDSIKKAMIGKHRISADEMKKLAVSLDAPLAVFQSKTRPMDSITALIPIRDANGGISSIVPIDYTARTSNGKLTLRITSVYGKTSAEAVQEWIDKGYLLYADRKNISRPFPHRLQLPGRIKTANRFLDENDFSKEALGIISNPVDAVNGNMAKMSVSGLYTGSAADYEKPLLVKVGTGEGSQVYGWGLYASDVKEVADVYAGRRNQRFDLLYKGENITTRGVIFPRISTPKELALKYAQTSSSLAGLIRTLEHEGEKDKTYSKKFKDAIAWVKDNKSDFSEADRGNYLYEQTFFTNRAPGDESHLLKWYEPVSEDQAKWIVEQAKKEGVGYADGNSYVVGGMDLANYNGKTLKCKTLYKEISRDLGSPQAASEFLARANIDGIKYPVDSYGKTVKDGDTAGWNYVSFRDDNIRVDHKWVDGQAKFAVRPSALGDGKQKYYEVPFDKAVDKIVKNGKPLGNEHVYVSKTPKAFEDIGMIKLPIMMTQHHVLTICNDAKSLAQLGISGNAHDMKAVLKQIPKAIDHPLMIIASQTDPHNSVIAITALTDKNGKTVIVPIELNGVSPVGSGFIDSRIAKSAFGKKNAWSKLVSDAIADEASGNVSVFYMDKAKANMIKYQLAHAGGFGNAGLQLPRGPNAANLIHSITDPGSPVKGGVPDQTQTRQFKEWFGKSKIVDGEGKPKVVYHGTAEKFTVFDRTKGRSTMDIQGMFFSPWKEDADGYGDNVGAYYLSIQNPAPESVAWQVLNSFKGQNNAGVKAREELQRRGYDGVDFGGQEYIVFEPTQVKSATDNIGTFDPSNPDIRFSVGNRAMDGAARNGMDGAAQDLSFDPSMIVYNPKLKAMDEMEQNAGGIAAAIEKKEALRPWTRKDSPCDLAKPIAMDCADMVQLFRAVSGSVRNPIIRKGDHIPGRANAIGLNRGGTQIELANKLFGMVDASDVGKLKADCTNEGYFRNEDPNWCAAQTKDAVQAEAQRSQVELNRRTTDLIRHRVATGEGGMHYATQVLGHEIGHTIASLPSDKNLGSVGNAMRTLYDSMQREMKRATDPLKQKKGEPSLTEEINKLITWWHGTETLPDYYKKPKEKFAELFGIFLTQPESVHRNAPKTYEAIVKMMGENERLALAYRKIIEAKWSGKSNQRIMAEIEKTWSQEQQKQFRELERLAREPISKVRDWFNFALNDRFGPMFAISKRGLAAEKKQLAKAVKEGAMSQQEANDRIKARQDEINSLKTALYDWQRQTGGSTRLMMADLDDVIRTAERDGVDWKDVRMYAHLNRVIELGGRATAHGVDPSRAASALGDMARELGAEKWSLVEKTWKAYRAVYERHALEDANVIEMFGDETMKFLNANKHYVTMKHRMGAEETAEWRAKVEAYKKGNQDAWDPTIDLWNRMNRGLKGQSGINAGFKLYRLEGSFEATEDPIAATMKTAIDLKENAARNHLLKTMSQTLRDLGVKGVYDTALEKGAKEHAVDPNVYERLTYMDGGVRHELIVPRVIGASFTTRRALPRAVDFIGGTMRFLRNTMTLWNPAFINRAYLIDKAALETNIKGLHKPAIDVLSEAMCFNGVGVPLYMVNNYLTRFTPIANTWLGKILWNEHTVNHYAHHAQKIARMIYEGRFSDRLEDARKLRELGRTGEAAEIEQNVALAREMLKKNVFQSLYEFDVKQRGLSTNEILEKFGYRIEGGQSPKTWYGKLWERTKSGARIYNRFEEEQEAVTKIVAYLYQMKVDEQTGRTSVKDAEARARMVIEQGGTPNLSARGVFASAIENATGFFWNVRKEGFLRTVDALKDHPTEWIAKNFAQTAFPALLKGLIATGGMELLIRKFFDDDEEKIKESWWAPAVLNHCRFVNAALKCVPGYYQRNYNVIPIAKFGSEVLSLRIKYSPEEFAIQNAIHTAMQKFGADPTDPSADWSTLGQNMMTEFLPNIFGRNYALDAIGALVGPLVGINPYDQYRERRIYDENLFKARAKVPGEMAVAMLKNFWNYSPLGSFGGKLNDGIERKDVNDELPGWLDEVLSTPFVKMIPASMLTITSDDSYIKGLQEVDKEQRAAVLIHAHDILVESIKRGSLGGFVEGLKEVPNDYRQMAIRHVLNGWRQWNMDPRTKQLKMIRGMKDSELRRRAWQALKDGEKYQD